MTRRVTPDLNDRTVPWIPDASLVREPAFRESPQHRDTYDAYMEFLLSRLDPPDGVLEEGQ